jgi:F-type H+-transporting ATPase subunit b
MLAVTTVSPLLAAGSFVDVDKALFYSTFVLFGLFALVLGKFGWGPLLKIVEEREKSVHDAVEGAQKAKTEAESLLTQHRELLREATREREEIVKRALAEAEQMRSDATARAKAEGEQLIQRAKEQIEREKSRAIQELRAEVGQLAIDAAARIVQSSLNAETQKKLVDDFITALPRAR